MKKAGRRKIIFHIGAEKTGTTSFQQYCTKNRVKLASHAVLYPTHNLAFAKGNHGPLVACYFPINAARQLKITSSHRDKETVLRSLTREIERASANTVLISAEHFSSRFSAEQIQQLAADFSDYDCQIAIVVRDHISRALSAYSTTIASGRHLTLEEFVNELCQPRNLYIRYKETVAQWKASFENIVIIPYVKNDLIKTLVRALISPDMQPRGLAAYAYNESLGASAIEALRRINERASVQQGWVSNRSIVHLFARVRHAMEKVAIRNSKDRLKLTEEQFNRLTMIAEIDRLWLSDCYGIRLEQPAKSASPQIPV